MKLMSSKVLYVQGGLGRIHKVTAIFTGTDAVSQANAYLADSPQEGVITVFADIVFIAACDDLGLLLTVHASPKS
jgi:hypothetical protein